jgi:signal transduction histidine kinase
MQILFSRIRSAADRFGTLKENLGRVVQHGKRADSIVKNMLLHSREGSGERRQVEINAIIDESLNLAYHGARAEKQGFNITLERDFDPGAGVADIYPREVTRVLLNLISNGFYAATQRAREAGNGFEPKLKAATRNLGDRAEIRIRVASIAGSACRNARSTRSSLTPSRALRNGCRLNAE